MNWYHWLALGAFMVCFAACVFHFLRLIRLGKPVDHAKSAGSIPEGIRYSFTSGMSPVKKESAYLHLPTYAAGIIFHLGSFSTIALFLLMMIWPPQPDHLLWKLIALFLLAGGICGLGMLTKRLFSGLLRSISNPDDYIANLLVSLLQFTAALYILMPALAWIFYLNATLLWLYFPLGKLKHAVYFFAARYHLGVFYGSRNVWPA
jgi:hypothetical protein